MEVKNHKRLSSGTSSMLIKALGGVSEVAKLCRVSTPAVSAWKKHGIPESRVLFLREKYANLAVIKHNQEIQSF